MTNAMAYLDQTLPAHGGKAISSQRLWLVVEGYRPEEEAIARQAAAKQGAAAAIVVRAKIDQSYEPRMISPK